MAAEDDLFKTIGGFGRYQKLQFLLASLNSFFGVDLLFSTFIGYTPDHWCKLDPVNGWTNLTTAELKNLSIPWDEKAGKYSSCQVYDTHYHNTSDGGIQRYSNASVTSCKSWDFDDSVYSNTFVTQWQLVCDKAWLVDLVPTLQVAGFLIGSIVAGFLSDRFGRWKGTIIFMAIKTVGCLMSNFAPNYPVLLIGRFILGVGTLAAYLDFFVLVLETTSPVHRTWMGVFVSLMFSFGSMFLAGIAYVERDWRILQLASTIPGFIIIIATFFFVYESPRWLLQRGEKEKGMRILRKIGEINKRPLFEKVNAGLVEMNGTKPVEIEKPKLSLWRLFSTASIRKYTFVCLTAWCVVSLIFYALSLSARSLSGNLFINFFLLSAVEVPANLTALACLRSRILGRRRTHVGAFLLAGVACLISVPLIVIYGKSYITTGLAIAGKAGASAAFTGIYIYTAELFPTEIRTIALGTSSFAARIGGILAPYAGGSLGQVWAPLPSLIFGVAGTLTGFLILLLPETRGKVLKDTVEEEEKNPMKGSA